MYTISDSTLIRMVGADDEVLEWEGPIAEFEAINTAEDVDTPDEILDGTFRRALAEHGHIHVGGGAAAYFRVELVERRAA